MLLTVADYQLYTGDETTASGAVQAGLADAQALIEEMLDRPLESAVRTETLRLSDTRRVYPAATPVTAVSTAGWTVEFDTVLIGSTSLTVSSVLEENRTPTATVTYTGGYTADTLPVTLRRAIALQAYDLLRPSEQFDRPAGATRVQLGDGSISYGASSVDTGVSERVRPLLRRYRRRRV